MKGELSKDPKQQKYNTKISENTLITKQHIAHRKIVLMQHLNKILLVNRGFKQKILYLKIKEIRQKIRTLEKNL